MKIRISLILVLVSLFTLTMYGQKPINRDLTVSGIVLDTFGDPLPGVGIFIKDAPGIGTVTDNNGRFSIKVGRREVIVFQMIGMANFEKRAEKSEDNVEIVLQEDTQLLEEVVITGLTSQKKVSIVGAITSVEVDELKTPSTSLANVLGGRVAGVISQQFSGEPGKNISNFWIRGIGTFGANSSALVLIDGLEGNLNDVDPDNVESFQILKDASATAVYGVRGANGVVLVTTKRGKSGKMQITGRATFQINQLKRMPEYLEAYDYAKLANEARAMSGYSDLYTRLELDLIKNGLDKDLYPNVNWMDEIMKKTSTQQRYYVNARGGSDLARYFVALSGQLESAAYKQEESKFKKPVAYNKFNYIANIDMNLTPKTTLYFGVDGNLTSHTLPGFQNTNQLWSSVRMLTPLMFPKVYSDGTFPTYGTQELSSPYTLLNHTGYSNNSTYRNMITLKLDQKVGGFFEGLTLTTQAMVDYENYFNEARHMFPKGYRATGRDAKGKLIKSLRINDRSVTYMRDRDIWRKYYMEAKADWKRSYGAHDIGALLYYYMEDVKSTTWAVDQLGINAIPARRQNLSGRISYGYNNTYFVDANFGYTGSSQFEKGSRYGLFPSLALGWVPTAYKWMEENASFISFLKFRGSYGLAGNDQIAGAVRFPYLTLINNRSSSYWGYRGFGITETQVGADNLRWEVAKKANLGMDIKFLNDNLSVTVDIFHDERDDIFMPRVTLPQYLGLVNVPHSNVGKMHSYGSDGNIEYRHEIDKDMGFTVRMNYTFSENIVDYFEENKLPYDYLSITGKPVNILRGYISEGLFSSKEEIETSADQTAFGTIRPGDIKYRDVNGDGRINEDDRVPLSYNNQLPRLMGGLGGDFRYKDLTFAFLFKGAAKVDYYRAGLGNDAGWIPFYNGDLGNVIKVANNPKNRWTPAWYSGDPATENPNAEFPRLSYGGNTNNAQLSDFWKRDGSYIRLQELSLRYKLKGYDWLNIAGLSSVDLEFVTNNVFTIDKVKYFDPEQAWANGGAYPIPISFTFQVYLNF